MKTFFEKSKGLIISGNDLASAAQECSENASVRFNRDRYCLIDEDELKEWLSATEVDRNIWAQQDREDPEFVCVEFSLLLWALIEQERIRQLVPLPFAFARVNTDVHSMNGFVNERKIFKIVEPQTDVISLPDYDKPTIQAIDFI